MGWLRVLGVNVCGHKVAGEALHEASSLAGDQAAEGGSVVRRCGTAAEAAHRCGTIRRADSAINRRSLPERAPARHYLNQTVSFQLAKRFRDRVPRHPVLSGQGTHRRKGLSRSPLTSLNPAAQVGLNTP